MRSKQIMVGILIVLPLHFWIAEGGGWRVDVAGRPSSLFLVVVAVRDRLRPVPLDFRNGEKEDCEV